MKADREKEAQREREEAERQEQEKLEEAIRRSEEEAKLVEEHQKEVTRKKIAQRLPDEPAEDSGLDMAKVRFRVPDGENIERRFLADEKLQVLFDFLTVRGYPPEEYKVLSSWPRRDVSVFHFVLRRLI